MYTIFCPNCFHILYNFEGRSCTKGGIYYRDVMNNRARDRAEKRQLLEGRLAKREMMGLDRQLSKSISMHVMNKPEESTPKRTHPRSILTLKSLLKQEIEEEEQEKKELKWRILRSQEKDHFNSVCNDVFKKISDLISSARPRGIERGRTFVGVHNYNNY